MKTFAAALAAFAVVASVVPAGAQPAEPSKDPKQQAKDLYDQGKRYFDVADYPHAIDAWKQAYVLANAPLLLFNIAQAYRLSGDCKSAMRFYANYEREQPAPPNKAELDQAKDLCAHAPEPKPVEPTPTQPVKPPTQPDHVPTTSAELGQADLDRSPNGSAQPVAIPPPPPSADHGHDERVAGLALGIGGVVLAGVGTGFAIAAHSDAQTAVKGPVFDPDAQSAGKRDALIADVTIGVGVAGLIGGGVLYYLGTHAGGEPHVGVALSSGHTEVTWTAHF